jgi:hypothetical protein
MTIKITKERLEQCVDNLFSEILEDENSNKFRCHEIIRLIRNGMIKEGYQNPIVRDGKAIYDVDYLEKLAIEWLSEIDDETNENIIEDNREIFSNRSRISVIHSWCEVGDFVIDHHNTLRPDKNTIYEMLTIIDKKNNLAGKVFYNPCGRVYRFLRNDFLYIPPQYITRIRI